MDVSPVDFIIKTKKSELIYKRIFDIVASLVGIIILAPLLLFVAIWIVIESPGGPIYTQQRVGRNKKLFQIYKFRSMYLHSEGRQLTISSDLRITRVGQFIRRTKIDELPQFFNVLKGDMSFVGPRPEVPRYVAYYSSEQEEVLKMRPGITDIASIEYLYENELLDNSDDPEKTYVNKILPEKLRLNLAYIENFSFVNDIKVILKTIRCLLK